MWDGDGGTVVRNSEFIQLIMGKGPLESLLHGRVVGEEVNLFSNHSIYTALFDKIF